MKIKNIFITCFGILAISCGQKIDIEAINQNTEDVAKGILDIQDIKSYSRGDTLIFDVKVNSETPHELWSILLHKYLIYNNGEFIRKNSQLIVRTSVVFSTTNSNTVNVVDHFEDIVKDIVEFEKNPAFMEFTKKILYEWNGTTLYKVDLLLKKLYDESGVPTESRYDSMGNLLLQIANDCNNRGHSNERTILSIIIKASERINMEEESQKLIFFYDYCSNVKWKTLNQNN